VSGPLSPHELLVVIRSATAPLQQWEGHYPVGDLAPHLVNSADHEFFGYEILFSNF
jgi:hypothetical protein